MTMSIYDHVHFTSLFWSLLGSMIGKFKLFQPSFVGLSENVLEQDLSRDIIYVLIRPVMIDRFPPRMLLEYDVCGGSLEMNRDFAMDVKNKIPNAAAFHSKA